MNELFSTRRIYTHSELNTEHIVEITFKFEDIIDIANANRGGVTFHNKEPKTRVTLLGDRVYWILEPYKSMKARWSAYLEDEVWLLGLEIHQN